MMALGDQAFGRYLGYEGGAIINGISVFFFFAHYIILVPLPRIEPSPWQ